MDYLDGGMIRNLKNYLTEYVDNPTIDEEVRKNQIEQELNKIMEHIDVNKKLQQNNIKQLKDLQKAMEIKQKIDLDKFEDVIREYCRVEQIYLGNILDAQDDYGSWHLAIVVEEKGGQSIEKKIHFLPYKA